MYVLAWTLSTANAWVQALVEQLKESADVVFPTAPDIGGAPGELQRLLEAAGVPCVGAASAAVALADDRLACAPWLHPMRHISGLARGA